MLAGNINITEKQVVSSWLRQKYNTVYLWNNKSIRVIYPGRISNEKGSDIKDAVLAVNKYIVTGDIELHVRKSDWNKHRHNHDPGYNNIILHAVMFDDIDSEIKS